jgi:histidine ammonia-lyase
MNSITDNPIITWNKNYEKLKVTSAGNFHGQAISMAFDLAGIAMTTLGNISERRTFQLISDSKVLPSFLTHTSGVESGFMILQYTAAALASENKTLAHPASADSIPTCANKEDFVSMGMWAAHKFQQITENTAKILAIELLAACKGLEFHKPLKPSAAVAAIYDKVRKIVPKSGGDKSYANDIELLSNALLAGFL